MSERKYFSEKMSRILGRRGTIFLTPAVAGCKNPAIKTGVPIGCFCLTVIIEKDYGFGQFGVMCSRQTFVLLNGAPPGRALLHENFGDSLRLSPKNRQSIAFESVQNRRDR